MYDFDGDGRADQAVYDWDAGTWYILESAIWSVKNVQFGWNEARPVPGDFDGDRKADMAVYYRDTGTWYILQSSTWSILSVQFGWSGARPMAGDFDGDGKTDMAVYDRAGGTWYILQSSTWSILSVQFGWSDARPMSGDFDGDGQADCAVYDRASGTWYILESATWSIMTVQFGWYETRPVPADYDGDGKTDIAVYYRDTGSWYILQSSDWSLRTDELGSSETRPAPADYDGDGLTDLAVYCRTTGTWTLQQSASCTTQSIQFGSSAMTALPSYHGGAVEGLVCLSFGDSITYGQGSSSDGPETGYPVLLEALLAPAFGGHFASINAGNPGEETEEGLNRFAATLEQYNPDIVLLMEGTNDEFFQVPFDQTEDNLRAMVATALNRNIGVIIATVPPVISNQYRDRSAQMALVQAFNPRIYQIAADYSIPVAGVYEAITTVAGWEQLLMDQPTANHPNDAGYLVVRNAFFEAMAQGINSGLFY